MSRPAWALSTLLVLYLLVVEPIWGRREYRRLTRRRPTDPGALLRLYHLTVAVEWAWVTYLGLVVLATDLSAGGLLTPPPDLVVPEAVSRIGPGLAGGMAVGLVVGAVAVRRSRNKGTHQGVADVEALLPATGGERRWFAAVAVTAGVCEEVVFRGFLVLFVSTLYPRAGSVVVVMLAAVVFGAAHAYQGVAGAAGTFILGLAFGMVYLATGSLVPGMMLHALIDLRLLLATRPRRPNGYR